MQTDNIASPIITNALLRALEMVFKGDEANQGWMNGILFSLEHLSAENASRSPAEGRPTPAAHVDHICVTLQAVQASSKGQQTEMDFGASWNIGMVTPRQWDDLKATVRAEYENTQDAIRNEATWTEDNLTYAINNVAHVAYHASAIRQLIKL